MNDEEIKSFVVGVAVGVLIAFGCFIVLTFTVGARPLKQFKSDAVRLDYGYYYPDEDGNPTFKWKDPSK